MPLIKLMSEAYKYLQQYKQKIINININKKMTQIYQIKYTYPYSINQLHTSI